MRSPNARTRKSAPSKFAPNYPASLKAVLLEALGKRARTQERKNARTRKKRYLRSFATFGYFLGDHWPDQSKSSEIAKSSSWLR